MSMSMDRRHRAAGTLRGAGRRQAGAALAENLLLVLGSVGFALLLFGALEGGLRLAGVGDPDASGASRLAYQQIRLPILVPAMRPDGVAVLNTDDPRLPHASILAEKPAEALRVFTFGGSATAGLGYSPNVSFSRHLERMLARAYPERRVEVVNLGIVALSSRQVRVLVEDTVRNHDADLVIVYSGNNEFLEIHAEKYARASAGWLGPVREALQRTNLSRFANRALRGRPGTPSLSEQDLSHDDLRLTQDRIIQEVEMTPAEVEAVVARYRANLEAIAEAAEAADTPLVLMTVASNWRWRGREDLPADWLDTLLGEAGDDPNGRYERAVALLTEELADAAPEERWELLYRRALAHEALGAFGAARDDFRSAMNQDPHLRRALDAQAEQVRALSERPGVVPFDTISVLARDARNGIVGFDEFYDYVHFTPEGALRVAAALFETLTRRVLPSPASGFDADAYVSERRARLETLTEDALARGEFMGIGPDPARVHDRDLWKYDRMVDALDARLDADPDDFRARVWRGNARAFRRGGGPAAAEDYRAALAQRPDAAEVARNLETLAREGRAGR
jgi:tetratricopeptide (TPR) repeat protein